MTGCRPSRPRAPRAPRRARAATQGATGAGPDRHDREPASCDGETVGAEGEERQREPDVPGAGEERRRGPGVRPPRVPAAVERPADGRGRCGVRPGRSSGLADRRARLSRRHAAAGAAGAARPPRGPPARRGLVPHDHRRTPRRLAEPGGERAPPGTPRDSSGLASPDAEGRAIDRPAGWRAAVLGSQPGRASNSVRQRSSYRLRKASRSRAALTDAKRSSTPVT